MIPKFKRLFALLLVAFLALGLPIQAIAQGLVTLGYAPGQGTINTTDFSNHSQAFQAALNRSKHIVVLPGFLTLPTPITLAGTDTTIEMYGATLRPTSTTTSSGQLFEITGSGVRLSGGRVELTQFTAGQNVININGGNECTVENMILDDQVTPSSVPSTYATTMRAFRARGASNTTFKNIVVLPARGLAVFNLKDCFSTNFENCTIGRKWTEARECWQGWDNDDSTHTLLKSCNAFGLGDNTHFLQFLARVYNTSGSVHHFRVEGGYYETVKVNRGFQIEGGRHAEFIGVSVASFDRTSVGVFCGVGATTDTTGTGMNEFLVEGCKCHDNALPGTAGAMVYVSKADMVDIRNNAHVVAGGPMIVADTTFTTNLTVRDNTAHSVQPAASWAAITQDAFQIVNNDVVTTWFESNNRAIGTGVDGFQAWHLTLPRGIVQRGNNSLPIGFREIRTAGAATNTNITVTGIVSGDIIARIFNLTDGTIVDHTAFSVTSSNNIQSASVSTESKTLLVEWFDI